MIAINSVSFPLIALVYEVTDEYVIAKVGSSWADSSHYVEKMKARKYKLYYDAKNDRYYWKKDGEKFYLDETLRTLK